MYEIEVVDYVVNGATGLIDVVVRAVSVQNGVTMHGPLRSYGTDATLLQSQYNGDVMEWLQFAKRQHQAHHGLHAIAVDTLAAMKGKRI